MCIYLPNSKDLTYHDREHIIPAGLGGIMRLPEGYVSDQFNNGISRLELDFLRNSTISVPRSIEGPGKRGSLSDTKSTKSKVSIIQNTEDTNKYSLGYIKLGAPFHITFFSLQLKTGHFVAGTDPSIPDITKHFCSFFDQCRTENIGKTRIITDNSLPEGLILFGIANEIEKNYNSFFAKSNSTSFEFTSEKIRKIIEQNNVNDISIVKESYKSQVTLEADFSNNYFRVYAKIAFNYLAHIKGKDFVLHPCFDSIRNWIASGGENTFANINTAIPVVSIISVPLPESSHVILIQAYKNNLLATVFLYSGHAVIIALSTSFSQDFDELEGYICDWKNRLEYTFLDYISGLGKSDAFI